MAAASTRTTLPRSASRGTAPSSTSPVAVPVRLAQGQDGMQLFDFASLDCCLLLDHRGHPLQQVARTTRAALTSGAGPRRRSTRSRPSTARRLPRGHTSAGVALVLNLCPSFIWRAYPATQKRSVSNGTASGRRTRCCPEFKHCNANQIALRQHQGAPVADAFCRATPSDLTAADAIQVTVAKATWTGQTSAAGGAQPCLPTRARTLAEWRRTRRA